MTEAVFIYCYLLAILPSSFVECFLFLLFFIAGCYPHVAQFTDLDSHWRAEGGCQCSVIPALCGCSAGGGASSEGVP